MVCDPQTQAMKNSNNTEPQISVRRLSCMFTPLFEYFSVLCGKKGRNMVKDRFSVFFFPSVNGLFPPIKWRPF